MEFDQNDAQVVMGFVSSLVVPFIVSFIKSPRWPDWSKWGLALLVSLMAGLLTAYVGGSLSASHVAVALVSIMVAANGHYVTWFKGLGIEDTLRHSGPFTDSSAPEQVPGPLNPEGTDPGSYVGTPEGGPLV